jgi:hypothetical protein
MSRLAVCPRVSWEGTEMINPLMRFTIVVLLITVIGGTGVAGGNKLPTQGVVPDAGTAVKIAEAVLPPIFGEEEVNKYRPYHAQLRDGIWTVYGTLAPSSRGGTPQMTIQKKDGKVIEVWHSQ